MKQVTRKRLTAWLLSLALAVTLLPGLGLTALAAEEGSAAGPPAVEAADGLPAPDAPEELCAAADPATYAGAAMCPVYVQHGTHDRLVPYEQSVEFVQALRDAGLGERVSFDPISGADHEDKLFFTDENLDRVRAFLERTMKEE